MKVYRGLPVTSQFCRRSLLALQILRLPSQMQLKLFAPSLLLTACHKRSFGIFEPTTMLCKLYTEEFGLKCHHLMQNCLFQPAYNCAIFPSLEKHTNTAASLPTIVATPNCRSVAAVQRTGRRSDTLCTAPIRVSVMVKGVKLNDLCLDKQNVSSTCEAHCKTGRHSLTSTFLTKLLLAHAISCSICICGM